MYDYQRRLDIQHQNKIAYHKESNKHHHKAKLEKSMHHRSIQ